MRWDKEVRIRIHGDEAEGAKYVSLARTLLGSLFQRNHAIMEGGLAPRVSDSQVSTVNREPIEQSVHNASVPGADIRVEYNSWMPVIDIWVEGEGEAEIRTPQFGSKGTRRLDGDESVISVAAIGFADPYFRFPNGDWHIGNYQVLQFQGRFGGLSSHLVYYPNFNGMPFDYIYDYTWQRSSMSVITSQSRAFSSSATEKLEFFSSKNILQGTPVPTLAGSFFAPLRTNLNSDKIIIVTGTQIIQGYNTDLGGVDQAVPYGVRYNLTAAQVEAVWLYPVESLLLGNKPGLPYLTPHAVVVNDTSFYTVCFSHTAYAVIGSPVDTEEAKFEAAVLYSGNSGDSFQRFDIRPLINQYLSVNDETLAGDPQWRFQGPLQIGIYRAQVYIISLPISDTDALVQLRLSKREVRTENGVTYTGYVWTNIILRCAPTGVHTVYTGEPGFSGFSGTQQLREPILVIQYWVYMGEGVILAKFIDGTGSNNLVTTYKRSFNYGATWETVPANGLPGNRLNQYYGDFCLVEPYVSGENMGIVLTSVYHDNAFWSYVSFDAGTTWREAGKLSDTEQFYRVDGEAPIAEPPDNFGRIHYYGLPDTPAPFNPALPELMRAPTP
jgi:hypothetical protein